MTPSPIWHPFTQHGLSELIPLVTHADGAALYTDDGRRISGGYLSHDGPRLLSHFQEHDLLVKPLGNTIYLMPPYCITDADLDRLYDSIPGALKTVSSA